MRVFLSCSGERSERIAEALYRWLPAAIDVLEPWMYKRDIQAGTRAFEPEVDKAIRKAGAGILCITPDNIRSDWLHAEANRLIGARVPVIPYLFKLDPGAIAKIDTLRTLGAVTAEPGSPDGTRSMLFSVNKIIEKKRERPANPETLDFRFKYLWPALSEEFQRIGGPLLRFLGDYSKIMAVLRRRAEEQGEAGIDEVPRDIYFLDHTCWLMSAPEWQKRMRAEVTQSGYSYEGDIYHFKVIVDSYYPDALDLVTHVDYHLPARGPSGSGGKTMGQTSVA